MAGNEKKAFHGKKIWALILLASALLVSCGDNGEKKGKYFDIIREEGQFFTEADITGFRLLTCFFSGEEPVLLLSETRTGADGQTSLDIWLQRADGGRTPLAQGVPRGYQDASWFPDGEGGFYIVRSGNIARVRDTGGEVFNARADRAVLDICPLPEGRAAALLEDRDVREIVWMDPETGQFSNMPAGVRVEGSAMKLHWDEEGGMLYVLDGEGIAGVDIDGVETERTLGFQGTSYTLPQSQVKAFRVPGPDRAELLLSDGTKESLRYVDVGVEKDVLVLRVGPESSDGFIDAYLPWLKEQAAAFNRENGSYHVVFETSEDNGGAVSYQTMTAVKLAAGEGADIIYGAAVDEDNVYDLLEKGLFEDLTPYIEGMGGREGYFPTAFDCWELDGKVYGIKTAMNIKLGWAADRSLVGDADGLTLEGLVDALLAYPGEACFCENTFYNKPEIVLGYFLCCSESICGAVDWGNGSCCFSGGLFPKILQASKRYGYDPEKPCPGLFTLRTACGLNHFEDADWLESQGKVIVDYFFDDGRHLCSSKQAMLAINAASPCKEGAWQFIAFLLGERAQASLMARSDQPVSREVFEQTAAWQLENGPLFEKTTFDSRILESWSASYEELTYCRKLGMSQEEMVERLWRTKEEVDEIRTAMEDVRFRPLRTMPILEIIYEEAPYYFHDEKTLEEVTSIITNRVQLYLDEAWQ